MGAKEGYLPFPDEFETICLHHAKKFVTPDKGKCHFTTPIVVSNFCKSDSSKGNQKEFLKGRLSNPTRSTMENLFCQLNKTKYSLGFASGMAAISAVLGLLKCGDEVLVTEDFYGGTYSLLRQLLPRYGINTHLVNFDDIECVKEALTSKTKLLWIETPSNPRLRVADLCKCAELAKEHKILTAVDNSFMTPYLQRPTEFGIDMTVQAVTKFMNGHSDVIMGAVCTNRDDLYDQLKWLQTYWGGCPSPFDCFQVMRGLKTLPIRMKRHHHNAKIVAEWLEKHPKICGVSQPSLPSHPKHQLFKEQASGMTGMISFYVKADGKGTIKFMNNLKIFCTAVSMGGYESILQPPFFLSHKAFTPEFKEKLGYTPNLIRMAIGIEDPQDLIKDLEQSLNQIK